MVHFSLELVWLSQARPHVDLVFVHGYGADPETTWHDEFTGKTWIKDEEFVTLLRRPVRIFSFSYNGDVAANLSSSSAVFHASDLLSCLEQALEKCSGRPVIFVAHGFGGIVVKKAIQLCSATPAYPWTKHALAGVVFFGTPHVDTDSEALLRAVRGTVAALAEVGHAIRDEEMREYASVVNRVNSTFIECKPKNLRLLSFWEKLPSTAPGAEAEFLVIPLECRKKTLANNSDAMVDCDHKRLSRFPSIFDARFMDFMLLFSGFIVTTLSEHPALDIPPVRVRPRSPALHREATGGRAGSKKSSSPSKYRRKPARIADDMYRYWDRRTKKEEDAASREGFMRSLSGWSEFSSGAGFCVAPDTCEWFKDNSIYKNWLTDPKRGTLLFLGNPGHGKSHLARAISTHLKETQPEDIVISFFCKAGEKKPALWEYLTWQLIKERPDCFPHLPAQHRSRDESSPRFGSGTFVEILTSIRSVCSIRTIFLVVDGLEQAAGSHFEDFVACLKQLPQPGPIGLDTLPGGRPRLPAQLKIVLTSRLSDAADAASTNASRCDLPVESVINDLALYVDNRFATICDRTASSEGRNLAEVKERIKDKAGPYWRYAKFAVDQVEELLRLNVTNRLFEDAIPAGLARSYDEKMLPLLQSVNNKERHLRTALTLIASEDRGLVYSVRQLEGALKCLYGRNDMPVENLAASLRRCCGDFLYIQTPISLVLSVHLSARDHLKGYLSPEQRHANMAFVCLKYLLQDSFRDRLPLSWADRAGAGEKLSDMAPFYSFAAQSWTVYVAKLKELSPQLVQLLRRFLSEGCLQYHTWTHFKAWVYDECGREKAVISESPVMLLLRQGCLAALQHFIPAPNLPVRTTWAGKIANSIRRRTLMLTDPSDVPPLVPPHWPAITGLSHQTVLMAAGLSGSPEMVEHVLHWPMDMNARDEQGRTALLLCLTCPRLHSEERTEDAFNLVSTLLRHGVDPNISESHGITGMHVVCKRGNLGLAQLLLDFGALVNVADAWDYTPLERAYCSGHVELVETVVRRGADADAWMLGGEPPLSRCIYDGKLDMFRVFLQAADVNQPTLLGYAPIHIASDGPERIRFLRLLLTRPDLDLDAISSAQDRFQAKRVTAVGIALSTSNYVALELLLQAGAYPGYLPKLSAPPLHDAVVAEGTAMAELLLSYGAPVNDFSSSWYPHTALGNAVDGGRDEMVSLLLDNGADPSAEEGYGALGLLHTALERASPSAAVVRRLLEARLPPDVNYRRESDEHCLLTAIGQGDAETVRLLLDHGADTTSQWFRSGEAASPLHQAAKLGHVEICEILLQHEPELLNLQSEDGLMCETPLIMACQHGRKKVAALLLDKGARADQLSFHYRQSPLLAACEAGDVGITKMLLAAAPEMVNVPSYVGCTPLIYACRDGKLALVKLLLEAGADISHRDRYGATCISNQLFEAGGDRPQRILELMMQQHGLDINAVDRSNGLTVLGVAVVDGKARHVRWLLERGADPLRCQRGPGRRREAWRNALQVAGHSSSASVASIMELLLEPGWGLLDHLTDRDWYGATVLPLLAPSRQSAQAAALLISACDGIAAQTGRDPFSALMAQPSISGLSYVDYAAGRTAVEPSAIAGLDGLIVSLVEELLPGPRTHDAHGNALDALSSLLLTRGGYDADGLAAAELALTMPQVRWKADGCYMGAVALPACGICDDLIHEPYYFCRHCEAARCRRCRDSADAASLHEHAWLSMNLSKHMDVNAPEVQEVLERLLKELSPERRRPAEQQPSTEAADLAIVDDDDDGTCAPEAAPETTTTTTTTAPAQPSSSSLQLAVLHAFHQLAIRRPAWTPFLPLSPATQALIAPWERLWGAQEEYRRRRRAMSLEGSRWRRLEEMQYLRRGLSRRHVDEAAAARDLVLWDIGKLYEVEEKGPAAVKLAGGVAATATASSKQQQ